MNIHMGRVALLLLVACILLPTTVFAHQPRITESRLTQVPDPEISKAYYGILTGEPDVYIIESQEDFDLYVNVLVPDGAELKKDVSAVILKEGKELAVLNGMEFAWEKFYEPFGADTYWMGPEYKARAEAGRYEIRVWSSNNDSKYSLAIGEIEAFNLEETFNALTVIPQLKKDFFNVSPVGFIVSPFGWGLIVAMFLLAGVFGLLYRFLLRTFAGTTRFGAARNIGKTDRMARIIIGIALLLWAVTTTWNPILLFFSGFAFFEALFSWCGLYAAIGRNTCPVRYI